MQHDLPDGAVALRRVEGFVVAGQYFGFVLFQVVLVVRPVRPDELLLVILVHLALGQGDGPDEQVDDPALPGLQDIFVQNGFKGIAHGLQRLGDVLFRHCFAALLHLLVQKLPKLLIPGSGLLVQILQLGVGKAVLPDLGQLVFDHALADEALNDGRQLRGLLRVGGSVSLQHLGKLQRAVQRSLKLALGVGKISHPHDHRIVRFGQRDKCQRYAQSQDQSQNASRYQHDRAPPEANIYHIMCILLEK